jgi:hypothetical protein
MIRKLISVALSIGVLTIVCSPANAAVWTITGGNLTTWFVQNIFGSGSFNIYESGFGTNAEFPATRVNGYNCLPLHTTHSSTMDDTNCSDQFGEGALAENWGAPAVYSGLINDGGTPGDFSNYTGTISWTGESGNAFPFPGGSEIFTSSVNSGSYDIATGVVSTSVASVTGNIGGVNCWNNPTALDILTGANFCANTTGGAPLPVGHDYTIARRYLPDGVDAFNDNLDGTIIITLADFTYSSCLADPDCNPTSDSANTLATWTLSATPVPVPAAVWLFGSALGLLGWMRCKKAS